MKTEDKLLLHSYGVIVSNTRDSFFKSIVRLNRTHGIGYFESQLGNSDIILPGKSQRLRVNLQPVETQDLLSLPKYNRIANLNELILYVRRFPVFLEIFGGIQGYDNDFEKYGRTTGSRATIPCISVKNKKIALTLGRHDSHIYQPFTLIVRYEKTT